MKTVDVRLLVDDVVDPRRLVDDLARDAGALREHVVYGAALLRSTAALAVDERGRPHVAVYLTIDDPVPAVWRGGVRRGDET